MLQGLKACPFPFGKEGRGRRVVLAEVWVKFWDQLSALSGGWIWISNP